MKFVLFTIAGVLCGVATAAAATRYVVTAATVTDLGTLGGSASAALDINDNGEIVGWANTLTERRHAFLYRAGLMEDIGTSFGSLDSEASGINRWTRVVGSYRNPAMPLSPHGFHWDRGLVRSLRDSYPLDCGETQGSEAFAISDSDYIAGRIFCGAGSGGYYEAARWSSPGIYTLVDHGATLGWRAPPFVWNNVAYDVNGSGTAAGRTKDIEQLVRWRIAAAPSRDVVSPLPPGTADPGWPDDGARAINDAGAVVGKVQRWSDRAWRAFFWAGPGSTAVDLGVLPGGVNSYGDDLNERRFIAGSADTTIRLGTFTLQRRVAFVYHSDFGMHALPTPAGSILGTCEAHAINELNTRIGLVQLVGYCQPGKGLRRAVRWDVTVSLVVTIPPGPTP